VPISASTSVDVLPSVVIRSSYTYPYRGMSIPSTQNIIIRLEARLELNTGFTLRRVFGGVHAFGHNSAEREPIWMNLEHCENSKGRPWQILNAIRAVATAGEPGEILSFCQVSNAQFHRFPVG